MSTIRQVWREALAQFAAERWRGVMLAVLATALTATVVTTELTQVRRALDADAALRAAGRDVVIAAPARDGATLPAGRCSALAANPAVIAAGGFVGADRAGLAKAPGEPMTVRGITGGLAAILTGRPTELGVGVAVTGIDADRLGIRPGSRIALSGIAGGVPVTTLDLRARVPDPGAWILRAAPPVGDVEQCWVEVVPGARAAAPELVAAWLQGPAGEVIVTPLLGEDRLRVSPAAQFAQRPTRIAWLPAGVGLGLVISLVLWFRRAEVALYRTVGASRVATALVHAGQYLPLLIAGTLAGGGLGLVLATRGHHLTAEAAQVAARQAGLVGSIAWLVVQLTALALAGGRISAYIRDRL